MGWAFKDSVTDRMNIVIMSINSDSYRQKDRYRKFLFQEQSWSGNPEMEVYSKELSGIPSPIRLQISSATTCVSSWSMNVIVFDNVFHYVT